MSGASFRRGLKWEPSYEEGVVMLFSMLTRSVPHGSPPFSKSSRLEDRHIFRPRLALSSLTGFGALRPGCVSLNLRSADL